MTESETHSFSRPWTQQPANRRSDHVTVVWVDAEGFKGFPPTYLQCFSTKFSWDRLIKKSPISSNQIAWSKTQHKRQRLGRTLRHRVTRASIVKGWEFLLLETTLSSCTLNRDARRLKSGVHHHYQSPLPHCWQRRKSVWQFSMPGRDDKTVLDYEVTSKIVLGPLPLRQPNFWCLN